MLNDQQLLYVKARLEEEGLHYHPVKEELLDHICCSIETKMQAGDTFSRAISRTYKAFRKNEFREIESNAIKLDRNKWLYRRALPAVLLLFLLVSAMYWYSSRAEQTPSILPIAVTYELEGQEERQSLTPAYSMHKTAGGIDFSIPFGTAVVATAAGKIVDIQQQSDNTSRIIIYHSQQFKTVYSVLSSCKVQPGQYVRKGEIIGFSGYSENKVYPLLRYQVICDNQPVDPARYFETKKTFSP